MLTSVAVSGYRSPRDVERAGALTHRLEQCRDGTGVAGRDALDRPAWRWGSRWGRLRRASCPRSG